MERSLSVCVGPKNQKLFGPRCGEPATHETLLGPRCDLCAEALRESMRDPNTLGNVIAGKPRTEAQIALLVRRLH